MRTLYIRATTWNEVSEKWGLNPPPGYYNVELFVRCSAKGEVNWDKTLLYKASELFNRNVKVIK